MFGRIWLLYHCAAGCLISGCWCSRLGAGCCCADKVVLCWVQHLGIGPSGGSHSWFICWAPSIHCLRPHSCICQCMPPHWPSRTSTPPPACTPTRTSLSPPFLQSPPNPPLSTLLTPPTAPLSASTGERVRYEGADYASWLSCPLSDWWWDYWCADCWLEHCRCG